MGQQGSFATEEPVQFNLGMSVRTMETLDYITDLLSELETIATVSGLTHLSGDIHAVISQHRLVSGKA